MFTYAYFDFVYLCLISDMLCHLDISIYDLCMYVYMYMYDVYVKCRDHILYADMYAVCGYVVNSRQIIDE